MQCYTKLQMKYKSYTQNCDCTAYVHTYCMMNVLEIMDVIICVIILMVYSIAIVIQTTCYIQMELRTCLG